MQQRFTDNWYKPSYLPQTSSPPLLPAPSNALSFDRIGHRCVTSRVYALSCPKWTQSYSTCWRHAYSIYHTWAVWHTRLSLMLHWRLQVSALVSSHFDYGASVTRWYLTAETTLATYQPQNTLQKDNNGSRMIFDIGRLERIEQTVGR